MRNLVTSAQRKMSKNEKEQEKRTETKIYERSTDLSDEVPSSSSLCFMFGVRAEGRGAPPPAYHGVEAPLHPLY